MKETRKKIGLANQGRKRIDMLGDNNPMKKQAVQQKISKSKMGDKNPNWKGGITPDNVKKRSSAESRLWRKACMERDHFTCQKTGQKVDDW